MWTDEEVAAKTLGLTQSDVRRLVLGGHLMGVELGGEFHIRSSDVTAFKRRARVLAMRKSQVPHTQSLETSTIVELARRHLHRRVVVDDDRLLTVGWQYVGSTDFLCDECEEDELHVLVNESDGEIIASVCPTCAKAWPSEAYDEETQGWLKLQCTGRSALRTTDGTAGADQRSLEDPKGARVVEPTTVTFAAPAATERAQLPASDLLRDLAPDLDDLLFGTRRSPVARARALETASPGSIASMTDVVSEMQQSRKRGGTRHCGTCDRNIPPGMSQCVRCDDDQAPAGSSTVCPRCGHWNSSGDRRCAACYKRLPPAGA